MLLGQCSLNGMGSDTRPSDMCKLGFRRRRGGGGGSGGAESQAGHGKQAVTNRLHTARVGVKTQKVWWRLSFNEVSLCSLGMLFKRAEGVGEAGVACRGTPFTLTR